MPNVVQFDPYRVQEIAVLDYPDPQQARRLLEAIAKQVQPILSRRRAIKLRMPRRCNHSAARLQLQMSHTVLRVCRQQLHIVEDPVVTNKKHTQKNMWHAGGGECHCCRSSIRRRDPGYVERRFQDKPIVDLEAVLAVVSVAAVLAALSALQPAVLILAQQPA